MPTEGREGRTPPQARATFEYNLDDVIGNGLVSKVEQVTLRNLIDEFKPIEASPLGTEIDPSDELCWLSLAVGWFLAKGLPPDVAKAAALAAHYNEGGSPAACIECGAVIPTLLVGFANDHHTEGCSLHTSAQGKE